MPEWRVSWDIDLEAESPEEAAKLALQIQRDPQSLATFFAVEVVDEDGQLHDQCAMVFVLVEPDGTAHRRGGLTHEIHRQNRC